MGIASLILGILSLILAVIPGCGIFLMIIPALVGLILGIVDAVKKSKSGGKKGCAIAGIILSVIAPIIGIVWTLVVGTAAINNADVNEILSSLNEIAEESSTSSYYNH